MPSLADDIKGSIRDVADTAPVVAIGRGIAKVGEVAQDAYRKVKGYVMPDRPPERVGGPPKRKVPVRSAGRKIGR